jgi:very-short-patch-repair endonuclease
VLQKLSAKTWALIHAQFGVISRGQLLDLGWSEEAIRHRLSTGRLHTIHPGIYAAGRPELSIQGRWMAAVLAGGSGARLGGQSMAEHLGYRPHLGGPIEIVVPERTWRRVGGLRILRSDVPAAHFLDYKGIPGVSVVVSLVQIARRLSLGELERAINQADSKDLITPHALRDALDGLGRMRGVRKVRETLDRKTWAMSRSELERRFRPIAKRVGLPPPETCVMHNGWEVDFLWRDLGLVVETDGLRYHRTPSQQHRDRQRDQAHLAAGDTPLRFTHGQVRYEPDKVALTLGAVVAHLRGDHPQH